MVRLSSVVVESGPSDGIRELIGGTEVGTGGC